VHSLAGEQLQESESFVGSERQKREEVVRVAMGSVYQGKSILFMVPVNGTYKISLILFQPVRTPCVFLDNHACFLLTLTFETVSAMYSLFLALVLFPQVQRRAQAELDVVIGRDRLPTFDDRPRLPYIEALCKELMRWKMATPMGTIRSFCSSRESE
jgi:Cytochrome P450